MAFLALASQKSLLSLQKNFIQFQMSSIMNQVSYAQAQMAAIAREYSSQDEKDYTEDADYIYYEDLDQQLETEKDLLESQRTILENEINSLNQVIKTEIKSSCTLNLAAGG